MTTPGAVSFYRPSVGLIGSAREADARARADERLRRQRDQLRPFGLVVAVAVAVGAAGSHRSADGRGLELAVALAVAVFAAALGVAAGNGFVDRPTVVQGVVVALMGAAGVAIVAVEPRGATALGVGAAVWMAVARLPSAPGRLLAALFTAALGVVLALGDASAAAVLAGMLVCGLLAAVAHFVRQARASQDRTELLLAQLEDAREGELRHAAAEERARVAAELHDVLAHALSGAAIQLQGARKLAERERAGERVTAGIERAAELVRDGLVHAREAVGALRGASLPGVDGVGALVEGFRRDSGAEVEFVVEGEPRPVPAESSLAVYRAAQEALTNIARYAPGASATVVLRYAAGTIVLAVENTVGSGDRPGLSGVGGGAGLAGLRERAERAGGSLRTGPTAGGWRVELEVPG